MSTRLPGAKYRQVFDRGRSLRGRLLVGWLFKSPDADRKAGVVVSKKTFRHAVDRNRAKRLMREAFRLLTQEGAVPDDTDWVFIARGAIRDRKTADVVEEMKRMIRSSSEVISKPRRIGGGKMPPLRRCGILPHQ